MKSALALLCLLSFSSLSQLCGVTPEWEKSLTDSSRRLQTAALARKSALSSLRIAAYYMDLSPLPAATVSRLKDVLLPSVFKWYANVLSVYGLNQNWVLSQTTCGSVSVPAEHQSGGVEAIDYLVYVYAKAETGFSTAARAGACAFDSGNVMQSPIGGTLQFNPDKWVSLTVETELSLVRHEMAHALGFSFSLFPKYRKADGTLHSDAVVTATLRGNSISLLATPKVLEKARAAFNCPTLAGLDLENQGGTGTSGSHWEKRIMLNDFMVAVKSLDSIYSDITFAALEDSGWYAVNYDYTDSITYGKDRGCDYFTRKCIENGAVVFPEFCMESSSALCDPYQLRKGQCGLRTYTTAIAANYQYFSDTMAGGSDIYPDYCPYVWPFSNGDCTGRNGGSTSIDSFSLGEKVCETCRCFAGTYIKTGHTATGDPFHNGCHQVTCDGTTASVLIGTTTIQCPPEGGQIATITGFDGYINCPTYEQLCSPKPCLNSCFGYGKCVSGACVCGDGYAGTDCSTVCDATCKDCSGTSASQCTACYGSATLYSGVCTCATGFVFDAASKDCKEQATSCGAGFVQSEDLTSCLPCASSCATCSDQTADGCTGCKDNAALPDGEATGQCTCKDGFYLKASDSTCQACNAPCRTCLSSSSCESCKASSASLSSGSCVCPSGFFLSSDGSACTNCDPKCKTCTGAGANACSSCFATATVNSLGSCECSTGFYYASSDCLACDSSCKTCAGALTTDCLSCYSGNPTATGECLCGSSSYITGTGDCASCSPNCQTCSGAAEKCTSCDQSTATLTGEKCVCTANAVLRTDSRCAACNVLCATCSGETSSDCLSCTGSATLSAGSCACNSGFGRSADNKTCVSCHPSCLTCAGPSQSQCQSCRSHASLSSAVCLCDSGFYMDASSSCSVCHQKCLACSGPTASNCISCKGTISLQSGVCTCGERKFLSEDGTQCFDCHSTCLTCVSALNSGCLTCFPMGVLALNISPGTCGCASGYFYSPPEGCVKCSGICKECVGQLDSQCIECRSSAQLSASAPSSCVCASSLAISATGDCLSCSPNCKTCVDTPTKCTSCDQSVAELATSQCVCLSSAYKRSDGACAACDLSCVSCAAGSAAGCLACGENAVLLSTPGVCQCASGYYPNPTVQSCSPCHASCKECSGPLATNCSQCNSPAKITGSGTCGCPDGYFSENSVCKTCFAGCKTCAGGMENQCVECFARAGIAGTAPSKCECATGTVPKPTVANCGLSECDASCQSCSGTSSVQCTACLSNAVPSSGKFPSACACASGFYPSPDVANCARCDSSCLTCTKASPFACLSCASPKVLVGSAYCADVCPTGLTAKSGVCSLTSTEPTFRLQLDTVTAAPVDSVSRTKVQSGSAAGSDGSDPVAYYQQGWLFDGVDDYLQLPPNALNSTYSLLLSPSHTVEVWARPVASQGIGCLISKYRGNSLLFRFCVTDSSQLLFEAAISSTADPSVTTTKLLIGGKATGGWASFGYQVKFNSDRSTKLSLLLSQAVVLSTTLPDSIFLDPPSSPSSFFLACSLQSSARINFFQGNIAEVSIFNYEFSPTASFFCGCQSCSSGNLCLSPCSSAQYMTAAGCQPCLSTCGKGCIRGTDCRTNVDPLCAVFASFTGCSQCSDLSVLSAGSCQCVSSSILTGDGCKCMANYQSFNSQCVLCQNYFSSSDLSAYFSASFLQVIVQFSKPVASVFTTDCRDLFLADTVQKLGNGYRCVWAADSLSLTVVLGNNSTLASEVLRLNPANLYAVDGNCSYSAVALEPTALYRYPLPASVARVTVPSSYSLLCSSGDLLIDASASSGGKGRSLNFTWTLTASPAIPALSLYTNFQTTDSMLKIQKRSLTPSLLSISVTVRNYFGKESTATATVEVTNDALISLEIDGGSPIQLKASEKRAVKVKPVDLCSQSAALSYKWAVRSTVPPLSNVNFPFLSTPSPPNTLNIPANVLKPGYNFTFSVSATDGSSKGAVSFLVSVVKSQLVVQLDRSSADIRAGSDYAISGERSIDPDSSEGSMKFAWKCEEAGKGCTDSSGNAVVVAGGSAQLLIPGSKLKENSTLNLTLTVSKDTRSVSKSVAITVKRVVAAEFSQSIPIPERVNPQLALQLALDVSATPQTKFRWTQIYGSTLKPLTPTRFAYLLIGENTIDNGAAYGFSLTATSAEGESSAKVYFTANYAPSGGGGSVSPLFGVALQTQFQVVAENFEDAEGDYPLVYGISYTVAGRDVAVGTKCKRNARDFKFAEGTFDLVLSVYDALYTIATVKLPTVTVQRAGRTLTQSDILSSFTADTIDSDRIFESVIAYSSSLQLDSAEFSLIFSTLSSYISEFSLLGESEFDASLSSIRAILRQNDTNSLGSVVSLLSATIQKSESALKSSQLDAIYHMLATFPTNSTANLQQIQQFLSSLMRKSVESALPDQAAGVQTSAFLCDFARTVSSDTLSALSQSVCAANVSFPSNFSYVLGLDSDTVYTLTIGTANFPNATSSEVAVRLFLAGRFLSHNYQSYETATELTATDLSQPLSISLAVGNYSGNKTYQCEFQQGDGQWNSSGVVLTTVSSGKAVCTASFLSTFRVSEVQRQTTVPDLPVDSSVRVAEESCDASYAPIAIVCAVAFLGVLLSVTFAVCERKSLPKSIEPTIMEARIEAEGQNLQDKISSPTTTRGNATEGTVFDARSVQFPVVRALFLSSHPLVSLCFPQKNTNRAGKSLLIASSLCVEMCTIGIFYQDASGGSRSQSEVWLQYSKQDFLYAVFGLIVGFGVSLIGNVLQTVAERLRKPAERPVKACFYCFSAVILTAAVAGTAALAAETCFSPAGKWAVSFLVVLFGEILLCETIVAAILACALAYFSG